LPSPSSPHAIATSISCSPKRHKSLRTPRRLSDLPTATTSGPSKTRSSSTSSQPHSLGPQAAHRRKMRRPGSAFQP
jgi:hypothetical protein